MFFISKKEGIVVCFIRIFFKITKIIAKNLDLSIFFKYNKIKAEKERVVKNKLIESEDLVEIHKAFLMKMVPELFF